MDHSDERTLFKTSTIIIWIAVLIAAVGMILVIVINKIIQPQQSALLKELYLIKPNVDRIINSIINGESTSLAYDTVSYFAETYGPRMLGSQALEDAQAGLAKLMEKNGFEDVTLEQVPNVDNWVRNIESLVMIQPRQAKIAMLGLGRSVPTPIEGITAEIIIVNSFDDLDAKKGSRSW
jgi:carboxypeptidase Q